MVPEVEPSPLTSAAQHHRGTLAGSGGLKLTVEVTKVMSKGLLVAVSVCAGVMPVGVTVRLVEKVSPVPGTVTVRLPKLATPDVVWVRVPPNVPEPFRVR